MTTILVTDDNEENRMYLEALFKGKGYAVISAENGAIAMEKARQTPPDLIISDIMMPVMDGFELCRKWKQDARLKQVPFIIYTATYTEPRDETLALSLGADQFLIKPKQPEELAAVVEKTIEDMKKGKMEKASIPMAGEVEILKAYNEVLFGKLEKKIASLESEIAMRSAAENKLRQALDALKKSNAELEKFAAATSHDLQEPLRNISNYLLLFKKKYIGKIDKQADDYINIAVKGVTRMSELIRGMLLYFEAWQSPGIFTVVDTQKAVDDAIAELKARKKEMHPVFSGRAMPHIIGDRGQVTELFRNLLDNAWKFVKKGEKPEIEISVEKQEKQWIFCVKDKGVGISPRFFNKIFVIFQQLHTKEEYEGSGIGLAVCKLIVERHGGEMWVESEEGRGASFYFTMPVVED